MHRPHSIFRPKALQRYGQVRSQVVLPRLGTICRRRRVPVLQQLSTVECGAACLAMILTYFGHQTSVTECRHVCQPGRDGITARTIAEAARRYGLRVRAFTGEPTALADLPLPAIVHWNFGHFVVLERWSPTQVELVDPAMGRRRLSAEEFQVGFTGVVLSFEPGTHFQPQRTNRLTGWRRYLSFLAQTPNLIGTLTQVIGASLLLQAFGLVLPLLTQLLVDKVLPSRATPLLSIIGIGLVALVCLHTSFSYLRARVLIFLQNRLDARLMVEFFERLLALPLPFFQQRTNGDLLMRLNSNSMIREILTNQTLSTLLDGGLVLTYTVLLLLRAPRFGLVVLLLGLLQIGILLIAARPTQEATQRDLAAQATAQAYLVEALVGIGMVKASGAEQAVFDHWSNLFYTQLNTTLRRSQLAANVETSLGALRTLAPLLLLWLGAQAVLTGQLSLGTMLALNALALAALTPLASLLSNGQRLQVVAAHLERITDVMAAEPEQKRQAVHPAPPLKGAIELKGVNFRYTNESPLILRNLSIQIKPGQKVALVGPTGSGKTTVAHLLLGFYRPTHGEICYDGLPLPQLDYQSVRKQIGIVPQDPFLFSGTIRHNLSLADPQVSFERLVAAAELAAIHQEISAMPMGYETMLAEGGHGLSGGQRQRLCLARVLVQRPAILLLDEPTSQMDVLTEATIEQNLDQLGCTRIVIAHRLSTIRNADLILVLKDGEIVERGQHDELMRLNGYYAQMVT